MEYGKQKKIAQKIGVSEAMYSEVKRGNRRFGDKTCIDISKKLGISFEFLKTAPQEHIIIAIESFFTGRL